MSLEQFIARSASIVDFLCCSNKYTSYVLLLLRDAMKKK